MVEAVDDNATAASVNGNDGNAGGRGVDGDDKDDDSGNNDGSDGSADGSDDDVSLAVVSVMVIDEDACISGLKNEANNLLIDDMIDGRPRRMLMRYICRRVER